MIKESFLRYYSLSKIYHQAQGDKNKLKVFYTRRVRNIIREKQEKERLIQRQKISRENREERMKRKLKDKVKTEFNQNDSSYKDGEDHGRSVTLKQNKIKERKKTELKLVQLKFNTQQDDESKFMLRNQKLKALRIRINNSIIHSIKKDQDQVHDGQSGFLRKNMINKPLSTKIGNRTLEGYPQTCRNQSNFFFSEQSKQSKRNLRFIKKVKENEEIKIILTKKEQKIISTI